MKKFHNVRPFLCGMLSTVLLLGLVGTAMAANLVNKELYYNDIKVRLNGKTLNPTDANGNKVEPFVIDGTTYLPIRAVGEALGLNVSWDGATSTVILGNDPEYKQPAAWLGEMETFTGNYTESRIAKDGEYTSTFRANDGSTYERYIEFGSASCFRNYTGVESSSSYLLEGQYSNFTGTIYLPEEYKNYGGSAVVKIYLDEKLVYTSAEVAAGTLPIDISIDVTGAYKMEISCTSSLEMNRAYYRSPFLGNAALWTD